MSANSDATSNFLAKYAHFVTFEPADLDAVRGLLSQTRLVPRNSEIISHGGPPGEPFILVDGMAYRYRLLLDGRRQILGTVLPGDLCERHSNLLRAADYSILTKTDTTIASFSTTQLARTLLQHPRIDAALQCGALHDAAVVNELLVALGRRSARERVAYFLCDHLWRERCNGVIEDNAVWLPLTQNDIGDLLGLTSVHVNRVLRELYRSGIISVEQQKIVLHDVPRLCLLAELDDSYLHLMAAPKDVEVEIARRERAQLQIESSLRLPRD